MFEIYNVLLRKYLSAKMYAKEICVGKITQQATVCFFFLTNRHHGPIVQILSGQTLFVLQF